jgi:hypothetical protein
MEEMNVRSVVFVLCAGAALAAVVQCGGSGSSPTTSPTPIPTVAPTSNPTPVGTTPPASSACTMTAPKVDCATRAVYDLMSQVLVENPGLFAPGEHLKGQGEGNRDELRLPAWRITDVDGYIAKTEAKLRANGFCAYVEKGDILKVKKVSRGNIFHEEMDVVQTPPSGGSYVSFAIKDRCHDAGF